ncbi:MAG: hypothetical protein ABI175_28405 [Polyangiales bacterium]
MSTQAHAPTMMERVGVRYLRGLHRARRQERADVVLDLGQRARLDQIRNRAVIHALIVGAVYGGLVGVAETIVRRSVGLDEGVTDPAIVMRFWWIFASIAVPASILEIIYLWIISLRGVHAIAGVASLELFVDRDGQTVQEGAAVAGAMARAALELPNPKKPLHGIDPMREASKLRLMVASIAYKLKVGVTKFVFKAVVRRVLVRAALRVWAPLIAIPVTAVWCGAVVWLVMREARVRALGASAVREMSDAVFTDAPALSPAGRLAMMRAVAACIVRSRDLHPNLVLLLRDTMRHVEPLPEGALDEPSLFLEDLRNLPRAEQDLALRVLGIAAVLDGRFTRAEAHLFREAQRAAGRTPDVSAVNRLRHSFVSGHPIEPAEVVGLA